MPRFRRLPLEIEAVQLRWTNWNDVCAFMEGTVSHKNPGRYASEHEVSDTCGEAEPYMALTVITAHGDEAVVRHGDWILRDSKPGTFYPCKPDIFAATYEPA